MPKNKTLALITTILLIISTVIIPTSFSNKEIKAYNSDEILIDADNIELIIFIFT